mmetsp:Transcript_5827/g.17241  ORF Transcript_5827/g.17241 Transcript_5827/m.17241 type:complete len:245 (-) Transcript_5827:1289-2023(-)
MYVGLVSHSPDDAHSVQLACSSTHVLVSFPAALQPVAAGSVHVPGCSSAGEVPRPASQSPHASLQFSCMNARFIGHSPASAHATHSLACAASSAQAVEERAAAKPMCNIARKRGLARHRAHALNTAERALGVHGACQHPRPGQGGPRAAARDLRRLRLFHRVPRRGRQALPLLCDHLLQVGRDPGLRQVGADAALPAAMEAGRQTAQGARPAADVQRDVRRAAHHRLRVPDRVPTRAIRGAVPR